MIMREEMERKEQGWVTAIKDKEAKFGPRPKKGTVSWGLVEYVTSYLAGLLRLKHQTTLYLCAEANGHTVFQLTLLAPQPGCSVDGLG